MSVDLNIIMVYTTVPSQEEARVLATRMVTARLSACVNILAPLNSIILEEGEVKTQTEYGLIFKIPEDKYEHAYNALKDWHPYTIPALLSWPVEVNPAYLFWAHHQTSLHNAWNNLAQNDS